LAYVLHKFGVRFQFLTKTIGVDPTHQDQPFYRATFERDSERVNEGFARAKERDMLIEERSLSRQEFMALMRPQDHMVMALVDRRHLYRQLGMLEGLLSNYLTGYVGHYILITGYDAVRDGYYVYDPGKGPEPVLVDAHDLDAARQCAGTDEDLLVIPWHEQVLAPDQAWEELESCHRASERAGGAGKDGQVRVPV
jgi:hypothetical protein